MNRRLEHVFAVGARADKTEPRPHVLCTHCGERLITELPMKVDTYIEVTKGFIRAHKRCRPQHQPKVSR